MTSNTAAAEAMECLSIVFLILKEISSMKFKVRQQGAPDQPVQLLEFRPTLVPYLQVNKVWAEAGTSIIWERYPYHPALRSMEASRRQWYANKVLALSIFDPATNEFDLGHLASLKWPNLATVRLGIDGKLCGKDLEFILHAGLQHLELLAPNSSSLATPLHILLSELSSKVPRLQSLRIDPFVCHVEDPISHEALETLFDSHTAIKEVFLKDCNIASKTALIANLACRSGLEVLEMDTDPGLDLLPLLVNPQRPLFQSIKRLEVMCYPEVALALTPHLASVEEIDFTVTRIPDIPLQGRDQHILDDMIVALSPLSRLRILRVQVGMLADNFPALSSLPKLHGKSLISLATSCPQLYDLTLSVQEPAAIDASVISSEDFAAFCRCSKSLKSLSLKFDPSTAGALEDNALLSLREHCHQLAVLRIRAALQLPSLLPHTASLPYGTGNDPSIPQDSRPDSGSLLRSDTDSDAPTTFQTTFDSSLATPIFPNLHHLGIARPLNTISIADSPHLSLNHSHLKDEFDVVTTDELVYAWSMTMTSQFPSLNILEAWGDWSGKESFCLNYFLPLLEPPATMWSFLSGFEQNLWDERDAEEVDLVEDNNDECEELAVRREGMEFEQIGAQRALHSRGQGSIDWEIASLMDEFTIEGSDLTFPSVYDDEPDDMDTPGKTFTTVSDYFSIQEPLTSNG